MNETIIAAAGLIIPLIGGLIAWIMNSFNNRIKTLEDNHDNIHEKKLDKEDYYRDQGALRETLRIMSSDLKDMSNAIRDWPEKMITILTNSGKLNG